MDATTDGKDQTPADQVQWPKREPRIWLHKRGGIVVEDEEGRRIAVRLLPREMRYLGRKLTAKAGKLDYEQASRIGWEEFEE